MFKTLKEDLPASLVVYLVALPLCLGIAIASDAPLFSGMIAGIVGGIIVGSLSGSHLSVSGPAAGLAVVVVSSLKRFGKIVEDDRLLAEPIGYEGEFELFLLSVLLAGMLQLIFGLIRAGGISNYIPSSVIKGMLAAIGLILIFKQIPHALGIDTDFEGDESFEQADGENTLSELWHSVLDFEPGALMISLLAGVIILFWAKKSLKKYSFIKLVPGALIAVLSGTLINLALREWYPEWALQGSHLVDLPLDSVRGNPLNLITLPDWNGLRLPITYEIAFLIAVIASIESLLSLEAVDKLDPQRRISPPNRELKAQGIGNIVSGLIGGLPLTAVIVRSSANTVAGAKSRLSAIVHGILLLLSVLFIPHVLNLIPKAALAAVLILVGYKLVSWEVVQANYRKGINQFIPFVVTIVAILMTDLLKGIGIGILVGIFFVIRSNFNKGITYVVDEGRHMIRLRSSVNYLNKGVLSKIFEQMPKGAEVWIDGADAQFIDPDIYELLDDFIRSASEKDIQIEIIRKKNSYNKYFKAEGVKFASEL
ncbi:MAG: SulP family inorganic anion transporter [Bacteroidetes bacterium]|nr:SulP family inorganic anion transporter [Bacteroidota bacterium]